MVYAGRTWRVYSGEPGVRIGRQLLKKRMGDERFSNSRLLREGGDLCEVWDFHLREHYQV